MDFFDPAKSLVENIYYLSGPLMLIGCLISIYQLFIIKNHFKITSLRDSAKLALEISENYFMKLTDAKINLCNKVKKFNIKPYEGDIVNFELDEYNKLDVTWRKVWEDNEKDFTQELILLSNLCESYSVPFIKQIADEDVAFNIDVFHFMHAVKYCYPFIVNSTNNRNHLLYINAIKLYQYWNTKLEEININNDTVKLEQKRISHLRYRTIKPLGSE